MYNISFTSTKKRMDSQAINKINVRYIFSILKLDDMLDQLARSVAFSNIDLKSEYN